MGKENSGSRNFRLHIEEAVKKESRKCEECCLWLDRHMPPSFFEEVTEDDILLIAHNLMGFDLQNYFAAVRLKHRAIALCLDSSDADLRILRHFQNFGIKNYRTFVSNAPPPFQGVKVPLRVAVIYFTQFPETDVKQEPFPKEKLEEVRTLLKAKNPELTNEEFHNLMNGLGARFLRGMTQDRLIAALDMLFRARTRDHCQYDVRYNEDWKAKDIPSMQVVLAWRNVPKHHFLYKLAKTVYRHRLIMKRVNATYINPYSKNSILLMSIALHGSQGKAAWEEADVEDFLKELVTLKYFEGLEQIETVFVDSGFVRGNIGNLIKSIVHFVHQTLVHADINMYSLANSVEGICRHPELIVQLTAAFEFKFHPKNHDLAKFEKLKESYLASVADLDTGNEFNDTRRKNILFQAMNFVDHLLKTNFYRNNKTGFSFRLDPDYLNSLPYDRSDKFPEIPFAIFFMHGMYYIGFHIRFKDLARGGLRTVFTQKFEQMISEANNVFSECYQLAYTQQKKNKDIPEGGAKGVIFLEPYERMRFEGDIYKKELEEGGVSSSEIESRLKTFNSEQKLEYLYHAQRTYIECFMTLINCEPDGILKAENVVDYWKRPEYIYLGPDENLHNAMIEWIANFSKTHHYKPGSSFITSKPGTGINHKEYGVTSYGVNVCMEEVLKYLGIDPHKEDFTIKISGGPDGDVAGNQILNLYRFFPKTAKLLAITDVSGTIFDPKGLDLAILAQMFKEEKPIRFYPPEKLNEGGFLLDLFTKKELTAYAQQTLCWRKKDGKKVEDWLSGNEMNHVYRHNLHQTPALVFIPGGGRPRTLNENNIQDFLDEKGKPTSKAIVEGANLYLTPGARRKLEELGTLIIKDSSANKGGVICSSFEVLCGLTLTEEEFLKEKAALMPEILALIREKAQNEARLLLSTHSKTGAFLTDISEKISKKINGYKYELLDFLIPKTLSMDPEDPLIRCLLHYCPPLLAAKYQDRILKEIPDVHKKAIIATYIACKMVYTRGLQWSPSIADILPLIAEEI